MTKFEEYVRHSELIKMLKRGGVEVEKPMAFRVNGIQYPEGSSVIRLNQPYGSFAKALLEKQTYPDLMDSQGVPVAPYDVTAHTLPLLMNVNAVPISVKFATEKTLGSGGGGTGGCTRPPLYLIYKSSQPSMDEGWTRWLVEPRQGFAPSCSEFRSLDNKQIRDSVFQRSRSIVFPDQSAAQILNGHRKGSMPDEYVGGVGKEGVENLKKFVEAGGTLVFLNRSSQFAIEQFNLPVKDVTRGLSRKDFYIPGSILRTELDLSHPIAKGMPKESIAWFENSPAFEILEQTGDKRQETGEKTNSPVSGLLSPVSGIRVIATYPKDPKQILLSGWALGAEKIAGKAALVEFTIGKGKIVLFGFRPQYRGQSLATFPLLFNAIAN